MAGATITNLAELIKEQYKTPFVNSLDHDLFLLKFFPRTSGAGKQHEWKIQYGGNTSGGSYAETDDIPAAGNQSFKEAARVYRQVGKTAEVTGFVEAATRGAGGFLPALRVEVDGAMEDLKNDINDMLLANTLASGTDIDGIGVIVADSGEYAGIDRATYAWWKSYVNDNSSTPRPLTLALMQDVIIEMAQPDRFRTKISHILTSYQHYYDYGNLMADQRRYNDTMKLDAGVEALNYMSIPVVAVPGMANGNMFFIDKRDWQYRVLEDFDTEEKASNKDSKIFFLKHYAQLICEHTGRQARITDLE